MILLVIIIIANDYNNYLSKSTLMHMLKFFRIFDPVQNIANSGN